MALLLRVCFALAVMVVVVWLLRHGLPFGALAVVLIAVWLRRAVESRREIAVPRS
ncbi:MAG TPA: hypothetical protein VM049_07620 [Gaiellaceae bacterium]|nr:hypothetical protein [Gaiellaceae bacterium]